MEAAKNLIITIVKKGWGDEVLKASIKAGADGGTVLIGRGIGVREHQTIMGICIEPEKEVVYSVTEPDKTDGIMEAIKATAGLNKPGTGLAFIVPVTRVVGVVHKEMPEPSTKIDDKPGE